MTEWTDIGAIVATWDKDESGWQIAPVGLEWIDAGARVSIGPRAFIGEGARIRPRAFIGECVSIGPRARIGQDVSIGEGAVIGEGARNPVDIGWADGYRKCIAEVKGVAYIGAGCRWFTLTAALDHWGNHEEDRTMTLALMESAKAIANANGWAWHEGETT
ncbi:MAG: hypothetical protein RQ750_13870 [Roseovarius sp.]|nr:hypothetical protein [Roseovarius sp.]